MKLQWLGHSSFRLKGKSTVITDPYDGIGFPFPALSANIVTVSHGHFDHSAAGAVAGDPVVVREAGPHRIGEVEITGFSCYHDDKKGALRGSNIAYLIRMDGISVVHLGDLGCSLTKDVAQALQNADVLLLPVGGHYTIDAAAAVKTMEQLSPKLTVPMHYKVSGLQVDVAPVDAFLRLVGEYTVLRGCETELSPDLSGVAVFEDRMRG